MAHAATERRDAGRLRDYLILAVMPLFFVSNLIIGRPAVETVPPWTLATLRWSIACAILLPFAAPLVREHAKALREQWWRIVLLGFLGMWICGGIVYVGLQTTTATHATLIYTSSPALVVLLAALFARKPLSLLQSIGVALAIAGVFTIILEGNPALLLQQEFHRGDLLIVAAAISWAFYSLLLKNRALETIPTIAVFFAIVLSGALLLLPCMIVELAVGSAFPVTLRAWASISGIVLFSSILSYATFQYGVKTVGPAVTSIFMYLLPCYGVLLAVVFLGEEFRLYHAAGLMLVMLELLLATGSGLRWRATSSQRS
jgi:drug/metabolite transporter (DMT)-like permease